MTNRQISDSRLEAQVVQQAAGWFGLLSSTTRLHLVWLLAQGEWDVGALAQAVGAATPAVSQHLSKLKLAGLVDAHREGRHRVYVIADRQIAETVRHLIDALATSVSSHRPTRKLGD